MSEIEEMVKRRIDERAAAGFAKYGVTVARTDIDLLGWHEHKLEEQLDEVIYTQRIIVELRRRLEEESSETTHTLRAPRDGENHQDW